VKKYIIAIAGLLAMTPLYANIVFPYLLMIASIHSILSLYFVIGLMLVAEFVTFIFLLPKESYLKIGIVVILMNLASAVGGSFANISGDFGLLVFAEPLLPTSATAFWYLYSAWFTLYTTIINTIIEFPIAWLFFGKVNTRKILFYIFIINGISVSIGTISFLVYHIVYGPIPV
jgi:hypothetical protein